jgi:hypothetical protein
VRVSTPALVRVSTPFRNSCTVGAEFNTGCETLFVPQHQVVHSARSIGCALRAKLPKCIARLRRALCALALCACSCATVPTEQPDSSSPDVPPGPIDQIIVPSERVGPISIGMTIQALLLLKGEPARTGTWKCEGAPCGQQYFFSDGMAVTVPTVNSYKQWGSITTGHVAEINLDESADGYHTVEGIGIGAGDLKIRSRLGAPWWERSMDGGFSRICYPGMILSLRDGKVWQIFISQHNHPCGKR